MIEIKSYIQIGTWYSTGSHRDLEQVETEQELQAVLLQFNELHFWATRMEALQELKKWAITNQDRMEIDSLIVEEHCA